ncbi:PilW family protein [Kushneria marisflavi]|nr:prepilin-type N-terminal cleavage/methylation domain-containing protein [Kushneria marisflavi]RKD84634.1 prepilin-type N-terminal cleavage/methylation domain-containing protein [Kushneria marisflavi]
MNMAPRLSRANSAGSGRHEQGLTLLEMMIALCIGSWVILAATGLYLSVTRATLFQQDLNTDQQGLQYVQQFLSDRLLQADAINPGSTSTRLALEYKGAAGSQGQDIDCTG